MYLHTHMTWNITFYLIIVILKSSPKNEVCHELLTLKSFQARKTFIHCWTQIKIFLMKSERFLTLHRQQCN